MAAEIFERTYVLMKGIKCIYQGADGQIEEKKSKFIVHISPAESEEEAVAFINDMKKKYWDATHNCSAFVIGEHAQLTRCSDDGETGGTAGRPMLEVLLNEEVRNAVVVVTRYFGGTLLGTGGLVRAYQGAVKAGLEACTLIEKFSGIQTMIKTDYTGVGKLQYLFDKEGMIVLQSDYADTVAFTVLLPADETAFAAAMKIITEATNGQAKIEKGKNCIYGILDGKVLLF